LSLPKLFPPHSGASNLAARFNALMLLFYHQALATLNTLHVDFERIHFESEWQGIYPLSRS